jgi:hypothetical protein
MLMPAEGVEEDTGELIPAGGAEEDSGELVPAVDDEEESGELTPVGGGDDDDEPGMLMPAVTDEDEDEDEGTCAGGGIVGGLFKGGVIRTREDAIARSRRRCTSCAPTPGQHHFLSRAEGIALGRRDDGAGPTADAGAAGTAQRRVETARWRARRNCSKRASGRWASSADGRG